MNKFLKLSTWKNIIESRWIYYQNRNKDWYKERKAICDVCPHNSKNKKLKTLKEKLFNILNIKKPFCTICGCSVKYLCSLDFNECSLYERGEEPKWKSEWK